MMCREQITLRIEVLSNNFVENKISIQALVWNGSQIILIFLQPQSNQQMEFKMRRNGRYKSSRILCHR